MEVVHPDSLELAAINQSSMSIARQISGFDKYEDCSVEIKTKAYELAVEIEKARMVAVCADSVTRLANAVKDLDI